MTSTSSSEASADALTDGRADESAIHPYVRLHLRFGWITLLVFITLGTVLEALQAFKSGAYLGVGNETRRLMWTLAHAHGVGLSLVNMGYAATLHALFGAPSAQLVHASRLLRWGSVLLPAGFFLGGFFTYGGDPGLGVLLAPVGALLTWIAALLVAIAVSRRGGDGTAKHGVSFAPGCQDDTR